MARKLKPVDRRPICDPANRRQIDPLWIPGPVRKYFWEDGAHRRDYLLWLARQLGFRTMQDFYRLELAGRFGLRHYAGGLTRYWRWSALAAVRDCFFEYDWNPALFPQKQQRAVTVRPKPPRLSEKQILAWADAYFAGQGRWPTALSGPVAGANETWSRIAASLVKGLRGLPGGSSLAQLLARRRGKRNHLRTPRLSERQILAWADAYFALHGTWPARKSGPIPGTCDTWLLVANALEQGCRGLRRRSTLAQLLTRRRGVRNRMRLPPFRARQVLAWADAYFAAQGKWPIRSSGPIPGTQETWMAVDKAMQNGSRGFPGGSSLAQFLARRRGIRNRMRLPPLKERQILAWAKAHFRATGRWPHEDSGPIAQAPGESWMAVDRALFSGHRGLSGGASLFRLLHGHGLK